MEMNLKMLLIAFMAVVIGTALLTSVADSTTSVTQTNTVNNETVTLVNATAVSLDQNQLAAITSVTNATNSTDTLTEGDDFTANLQDGTITSLGRGGNFNVTYTWREVGDSTARTLVSFNALFFTLGIMLLVYAIFDPGFKNLMEKFR